jgi:AraC family transcriptional regulator
MLRNIEKLLWKGLTILDQLLKEKLGYYDKGIISKRGVYLHMPSEFAKEHLLHVLWSADLTCRTPYELHRKHTESYKKIYSVIYIVKGEMNFDYEGEHFVAFEGDIIFLYSGVPNHYWTTSEVQFRFIHFSGDLAEVYYNLLVKQVGPHFKQSRASSHLFSSVLNELEQEIPNDHKLSSYLLSILSSLTKQDKVINPAIKEAKYYIEKNYKSNLPLENIANHVGLSRYHFSRLFKQELSVSPHQYIINLRLKLAKQSLMDTTESIENIAFTCGFSTPSHFIDCFKKNVGMTPFTFRTLFITS